jgi:hypothetical protein
MVLIAMPKLIRVGFFREMRHGEPDDPSLAALRSPTPGPHQVDLARYLDAGHVLFATPGFATDVLDGTTRIGPPHYLTDGQYVWPGDAAHYVRTYNVRLPDEFVAHVVASGAPPATVDLATLTL